MFGEFISDCNWVCAFCFGKLSIIYYIYLVVLGLFR